MNKSILWLILGLFIISCEDDNYNDYTANKGIQVNEISEDEDGEKKVGLPIDSLKFETRPRNVLPTKHANHRLTPIYKVNYHKKTGKPYFGSNSYHTSWSYERSDGNVWNYNYMPGFKAVYGYNFVNVSHYNNETKTQNEFFPSPVLIKTLYFPAFSNDTLNHQPVERNYYMVSVYDEDTNKDGFINFKDLRRFYLFDIDGKQKSALVPKSYTVMSSEYDSANDYMYVFAKKDANKNGNADVDEPIHIFWIDLKNPELNGVQYINN